MDTALNIRCFCLAACVIATTFAPKSTIKSRIQERAARRKAMEDQPQEKPEDSWRLTYLQEEFINHVIDLHHMGERATDKYIARRMKISTRDVRTMATVTEKHGYVRLSCEGKRKPIFITPLKYSNGQPFIVNPIDEYVENGHVIKRYPAGYAYGYGSDQIQDNE